MDKSELIRRIQQAATLFQEGRYYESFQIIEPIQARVRHEKVSRLYKASRRKVLESLQHLTEENRPGRIVELNHQFLSESADPEIRLFVEEAEKAVRQSSKPEPEALEISIDDIDPALEDPITEVISDSWIRGVASDDTVSDVLGEPGTPGDQAPEPEYEPEPEPESEASIPLPAEPPAESGDSAGSGDLDINELIQRGVSLYEVGDVFNALKTWEHGLTLDPDNIILKEYIANARRELDETVDDGSSDIPQRAPTAPPAHEPERPREPLNRDELNQIVAKARAGEVEEALRDLEALAGRTGDVPEIVEARTYLGSLAQEYGVSTAVAKARQLMEEKKTREAVRLLEDQTNRYPDNDQLRTALEHARRRLLEEPPAELSLELDFDAKGEETSPAPPPPAAPVEAARKKRPRAKPVVMKQQGRGWKIGLVVAVIVAIAAAVVWLVLPQIQLKQFTDRIKQDQTEKQPATGPTDAEMAAARVRTRDSAIQQARNMFNHRRYLFAYYLFLHAESIAPLSDDERQFLTAARSEMVTKLNEKRVRRRAETAFRNGDYEAAADGYYQLLSANPDNIAFKKRLFECYEKAGVKLAFQGMAEQAREYFVYAGILEPGNPTIQKHQQVIGRYISGIISRAQLTEWFFFFQ